MGIITSLITRALPLEGPYPLTAQRLVEALGGRTSVTGRAVNEQSALGVSAVYSCVRVLADSVAALPLLLYQRQARGKARAVDHPLYRVLHEEPNPWMTPYQLKETLMGHVLLWGNAYAQIVRDFRGRVIALWPLRPQDMVKIERAADGSLLYTYRLPNRAVAGPLDTPASDLTVLAQQEVFHLRGLSPDGVRGYSPIALHREALGLAMAAEEFGARFFSNSAIPEGVLQAKTRLSDTALKHIGESWRVAHQGLSEAHRVAILEEGVEWKATSLPPGDLQFIEGRQFQLTEISRIFRVPPHKISDLNRATYSNVDKQEQQFKGDSLEPWLVRIEEQISLALLSPVERRDLFAEFLMDAQWRADIRTRYEAYARGKQWGWLSTNDIREFENLNPVEGGDEYWQPVNMMEMGSEPPEPVTAADVRALLSEALAASDEEREGAIEAIEQKLEGLMTANRDLAVAVRPQKRARLHLIERDGTGRIKAVREEEVEAHVD